MQRILAIVLWLVAGCLSTHAHEYWLEADLVNTNAKPAVAVRLFFGEDFSDGTEKPLQVGRTSQFILVSSGKKPKPLPKIDGSKPLALITPPKTGTLLVAMERSSGKTRFGRSRFIQFATAEGYRFSPNEPPLDTRSIYETHSRYLKTLVQMNARLSKPALAPVGHTYEIVPLIHPHTKNLQELTIRVLFRGKPAPGVKVRAEHRHHDRSKPQTLTTSADGTARIALAQKGDWLIRSVFIEKPISSPADYQSHWASLTFRY